MFPDKIMCYNYFDQCKTFECSIKMVYYNYFSQWFNLFEPVCPLRSSWLNEEPIVTQRTCSIVSNSIVVPVVQLFSLPFNQPGTRPGPRMTKLNAARLIGVQVQQGSSLAVSRNVTSRGTVQNPFRLCPVTSADEEPGVSRNHGLATWWEANEIVHRCWMCSENWTTVWMCGFPRVTDLARYAGTLLGSPDKSWEILRRIVPAVSRADSIFLYSRWAGRLKNIAQVRIQVRG